MSDPEEKVQKSGFSLDWLVGGALTRIGETVDRVTGRGWNPSSSLATSRLSEKLCFLLDEEARDGESGGKFVPHIITLKMQWNKFSEDVDDDLEKLRDELHAAAIDHINDRRYHTYAALEIEIKTDYFTEGVRITGSFGDYGDDKEDAAVDVTLPNITFETTGEGSRVSIDLSEGDRVEPILQPQYKLTYEINGEIFEKQLDFAKSKRFTIGRGNASGISIEHQSVSKVHASLVLSADGKLLIADTGSTNGTYVSGRRIEYGKAAEIGFEDSIRIGSIEVGIEMPPPTTIDDESAGTTADGYDAGSEAARDAGSSNPVNQTPPETANVQAPPDESFGNPVTESGDEEPSSEDDPNSSE